MAHNRTYPRKPSSMAVEVQFREKTLSGAITDLSNDGAFIRLDEEIGVGEKVSLDLAYLSLGKPFSIQGMVVNKRPGGIGVKFHCLSQEQQNLLSFLYW